MSRPVSSLRNLGPRSDASFTRAGIHSAEELIALGPDAAYRRLLASGARPHFAGYWALVLAIEDRHGANATATRRRPCAPASRR